LGEQLMALTKEMLTGTVKEEVKEELKSLTRQVIALSAGAAYAAYRAHGG
jgi:hypothetical protein